MSGFLAAAGLVLVNLAFWRGGDVWTALFVVALVLGAASLACPDARRFRVSTSRVLAGLGIGLAHVAVTKLLAAGLSALWPGWAPLARALYGWKGGHSTAYLAVSLVLIVLAEELVWRGAVTRALARRAGRAAGVAGGALLFAAAHAASGSPLLLGAAVLCGAFWGALAEAFDDLTPPFVAHLVWDVALLFVWPLV